MVLAAMLAMMMVAAAPAYAQDAFAVSGEGDATATGGDVTVVDASQTATVDVSQVQTGDATAVADDGSLSFASVDSSLDVTVNQVNGGFGEGFFVDDFGFVIFF